MSRNTISSSSTSYYENRNNESQGFCGVNPIPTGTRNIDWSKNIILQSTFVEGGNGGASQGSGVISSSTGGSGNGANTSLVEFIINREAAKLSGLIKDMLEDSPQVITTSAGDGSGSSSISNINPNIRYEETVIPIPNVSAQTLSYIIQYMEHHYVEGAAEPIEKPLRTKIEDVISDWDRCFIFTDLVKNKDERQHELLIDVIMAANFLNIKDLLDLTCATVASIIRGKTPEQIRALFNIENDFTKEEEERIMAENHWCEEV